MVEAYTSYRKYVIVANGGTQNPSTEGEMPIGLQGQKRKSDLAGSKARVENTMSEDRKTIAQKAATARWG